MKPCPRVVPRRRRRSVARVAAGLFAVLLAPGLALTARDAGAALSVEDVAHASLEELMGVRVTTVTGAEADWFSSPAALSVITGEQLERTGHRTLADLLRVMPGVFVGNVNAHSWTVGMRGFTGGLANKTLVLIDGRPVYDPLLGGTFWDIQDILLADLDRIEVIRGPGATLWGANAVNGVINVITKPAKETQGSYVKAGGGNEDRGFVAARFGGRSSENGSYRVWGKYQEHAHDSLSDGSSAHDAWDLGHGGFRYDYDGDGGMAYTAQGDIYNLGHLGEAVRVPVPEEHLQFNTRIDQGWANGGNVLLRATHDWADNGGWSLQGWYDRTKRKQSAGVHFNRDSADLDFRHHFRIGDRNEVIWGLEYRYSQDDTRPGETLRFEPESRSIHTESGFVQDTVTLLPDRVFAMIGSKLENNSFTGFEVQPSARLWWTPDERNTLWAAVSRPVRVLTRIEQDVILTTAYVDTGLVSGASPSGVYLPITITGDRSADSEKLIAYEAGYRRRLLPNWTIDVAPFYNDYTHLVFAPKAGFGELGSGSGESYGIDVSTMWKPFERWSLNASYSWLDVEIHGDLFPQDQQTFPHNMVKLLSWVDLTDTLEWNTGLYYMDKVPAAMAPHYVRLDQGITWKARPWLDLSLWGQNLLEDTHREASAVRVERAFYLQAELHF